MIGVAASRQSAAILLFAQQGRRIDWLGKCHRLSAESRYEIESVEIPGLEFRVHAARDRLKPGLQTFARPRIVGFEPAWPLSTSAAPDHTDALITLNVEAA